MVDSMCGRPRHPLRKVVVQELNAARFSQLGNLPSSEPAVLESFPNLVLIGPVFSMCCVLYVLSTLQARTSSCVLGEIYSGTLDTQVVARCGNGQMPSSLYMFVQKNRTRPSLLGWRPSLLGWMPSLFQVVSQ